MKFDLLVKNILSENVYARQYKSGRQSGASLKNSVIGNRYLPELLSKIEQTTDKSKLNILDAGAGKHAFYTLNLRNKGYNVKAIDVPENMVKGVHNPDAYSHKYDVVFSSRVLNVFSDASVLENFIKNISNVVVPGGYYLADLPTSPRDFGAYAGLKPKEGNDFLKTILSKYFSSVEIISPKGVASPVFLSKK